MTDLKVRQERVEEPNHQPNDPPAHPGYPLPVFLAPFANAGPLATRSLGATQAQPQPEHTGVRSPHRRQERKHGAVRLQSGRGEEQIEWPGERGRQDERRAEQVRREHLERGRRGIGRGGRGLGRRLLGRGSDRGQERSERTLLEHKVHFFERRVGR